MHGGVEQIQAARRAKLTNHEIALRAETVEERGVEGAAEPLVEMIEGVV
jgi:hypothetical protein